MTAPTTVRPLGLATCCRAIRDTATGVVRPRRPTTEELAAVPDAGLPHGTVTVRLRALPQVARDVATPFVAEGVWRRSAARIGLRTFVIEHPQARMLIDPSVAVSVRRRVLAEMPAPLRAAVMPPADILSTVEALAAARVDPRGLDFALPTHLHWDHVCGLLDLPDLPTRVHRTEWDWAMDGELAPAAGVRGALTGREVLPYELEGPPVLGFGRSTDLFGDGSVVLLDLAGHTPGSVGVLLRTEDGPVLLAGDAAWHHVQVEHAAQKAGFPGLLVDDDREATYQTLTRLHAVREQVFVLPSHDHDRATAWE